MFFFSLMKIISYLNEAIYFAFSFSVLCFFFSQDSSHGEGSFVVLQKWILDGQVKYINLLDTV